jgi:DNA modification methylase
MAHWSEDSQKLKTVRFSIESLGQLEDYQSFAPNVYLFHLPFPREIEDANKSQAAYEKLADYCDKLHSLAVVCVLTTPADAASLMPYLEKTLKFKLWVAVKTKPESYSIQENVLLKRHAALLIFTKYDALLKHTKTRVQYTYCPACKKTTKDYGGKKHTYHEYGTLLSDVWRDVECNPKENINIITERISDLFGIEPYQHVRLFDLRECVELLPLKSQTSKSKEESSANFREVKLESSLINDDCLNALKNIPSNSIDFCFADPPYNLKKKYDKWDDALESIEYFSWCDKWLTQLYRVLKPNRTLAVLNIPLWAVRHFQHLNSFANFQSWIAWDGLSFPVRMIMPAHYAIICFSKGDARPLPYLEKESAESFTALAEFYCLRPNCIFKRNRTGRADQTAINDLWHDIHRLKHNSRRVDHPCQLPPMLMQRLYEIFTKPGEMILDCFNGAGTSTLVAAQMNRRYIGIELSLKYHEIAFKRHEQLLKGIDPFGKVNTIPTVKNSSVERLPKQKYEVTKKKLQLDVKRIAQKLKRLPTKDEVREMSEFPIEYFERYFVSWGEVCAAARTTGMVEDNFDHSEVQSKLF